MHLLVGLGMGADTLNSMALWSDGQMGISRPERLEGAVAVVHTRESTLVGRWLVNWYYKHLLRAR